MRIDDNGMANAQAAQLNRTQGVEQSGEKRVGERSGQEVRDQVSLSSLASSVQSLQPDSAPREAYLAELAAQFREGRLQRDPERIADGLIDQALGEAGLGDPGGDG
jgi:flagellar biosynthesis anti-sigma factor FlgM